MRGIADERFQCQAEKWSVAGMNEALQAIVVLSSRELCCCLVEIALTELRRLIACPSVGLSPMWQFITLLLEAKQSKERRSLWVYSWRSGVFVAADSDCYISQLIEIICVLVVRKMAQMNPPQTGKL